MSGKGAIKMKNKKIIGKGIIAAPAFPQAQNKPGVCDDPDRAGLVLLLLVGKLFNRVIRQSVVSYVEKNKTDSDYVN